MNYEHLKLADPELYASMERELGRQRDHLELIASENFTSPAVMEAVGSHLTNKYAEGYPGARYYGGCDYVDEVERLAIDRVTRLFGADHANVQPHSGSQANMAVYAALLQPGDRILGMNLSHGGHLTHGSKASLSGKYFEAHFYGVDPETETIDYDALARVAEEVRPKLIIADEPTTALDVTIQAQILDLLRNLKDQINSSIMFITHDLGVIAEMADYVVVMYAGRIVEQGTAEEIFSHPAHPYTIGLMASKPVVGRQVEKLYSIPGKVPNPINMPNYCYFKDRCEMCVNGCEGDYPCEVSISPTHKVSCYRYYDGKRPDLEEVVEEELAEGKENGKEGE